MSDEQPIRVLARDRPQTLGDAGKQLKLLGETIEQETSLHSQLSWQARRKDFCVKCNIQYAAISLLTDDLSTCRTCTPRAELHRGLRWERFVHKIAVDRLDAFAADLGNS